MGNKRVAYLDIAKGIGIIMVVWAHARGPFSNYMYLLQFAPSSGHWCVCQRPLGGVQRPPLLRFFDRLNDNNVVLRCPLHYSVGRYLVIHDHRFPTPRFTLGADNGTLG